MIACKLAIIAPDRVMSLAMLSTTGGGYQCLPKVWVLLKLLSLMGNGQCSVV